MQCSTASLKMAVNNAVELAASFSMGKTLQLNELHHYHIFYHEMYFLFRNVEYCFWASASAALVSDSTGRDIQTAPKISNSRTIPRVAPIVMIFTRNRSHQRDLFSDFLCFDLFRLVRLARLVRSFVSSVFVRFCSFGSFWFVLVRFARFGSLLASSLPFCLIFYFLISLVSLFGGWNPENH